MGNKKNVRKKIPTAKKLAADPAEDSDSPPHQTSARLRPKPRPTWKGATTNPKPAHAEALDTSMDVSDAGGEEDMEVEEDWDDVLPSEEDEDAEEVKSHRPKAAARPAPAKINAFQIPFEVSVNGRYKELPIPSNSTWEAAQILIGRKMLRDPEALSLGYVNPFKPRSAGKSVPSSLENEEEWNGLIQHVRMFLTREKAKNRGRGGMTKPWTIILVDMGRDAGNVNSRTNTKGSKNKQFEPKQGASGNNADLHNDNDNNTSGPRSDSHTLGEICRRHHCDRCGRACFIDPGPPPTHKPFTMEQLTLWTTLVRLKSATIDQVPDALRLPKRKDREPLPPAAATASGPVTQAIQPNPSHLQVVANTMSTGTNSDSQGYYAHPGFPTGMHGFPSFPAPAFPMQTYPNYHMPAPMYAPPYGYPFAGATHCGQAMQPNGYPAPAFLMQNYPMLNYPMPTPMYAPPSSYPFAMPPAPQGASANLDYGRKHQSNPQASSDLVDEAGILQVDTSNLVTVNDWLNSTDPDTLEP